MRPGPGRPRDLGFIRFWRKTTEGWIFEERVASENAVSHDMLVRITVKRITDAVYS